MVVVSIGPTTSEMLQHLEIPIDLEPEHPKMGHLVQSAAERSKRLLEAKRLLLRLPRSHEQTIPLRIRQSAAWDSVLSCLLAEDKLLR